MTTCRWMTLADLSKGLRNTAQAVQDEAKFILEVADGKFKLPKDPATRDQLIDIGIRSVRSMKIFGRTLVSSRQGHRRLACTRFG
jgi:hypothetical protein